MSIITLITDFGLDDEYVGLMKGVMLSIQPSATIVDITHHIGPQDTVQAAYAVDAAYRYFPAGSVHLIIVDPGVGGQRAVIAVKTKGHVFIAPDNGVLTLVLDGGEIKACIRADNPEFFLKSISQTFHGRDIFAPVAAHIAGGISLNDIGHAADVAELVRLPDLKTCRSQKGEITGKIVSIDHFGNLITNIPEHQIHENRGDKSENNLRIRVGKHIISGLSHTYESVASGKILALIGSRGYLEIAANSGSAAKQLNVQKGDGVTVVMQSANGI
jgi:S-adenosylmethionine hydrolase